MRKVTIYLILVFFVFLPFHPILAYNPSYRFTDQELDFESGLYYFDSRIYNPDIGRFTQPDSVLNNLHDPQKLKQQTGQDLERFLSNPQNLNPYSYVGNNPIIFLDPTGEFKWETGEVEKGDTLYGVFGNNWKEVANYNKLENPDLIFPGQHLDVPEFVQKNFWQNIADFATTILPGFSDARDIIETRTNKDLITGRALTPGEEILTGSVALLPVISGRLIRSGNKVGKWLTSKIGERSDWIRFGETHIPKDVSGLTKDVFTRGIKGGGINKNTGFKLPFHYHIHKYNWYKPWTWFK